jgi:hypothetical protein
VIERWPGARFKNVMTLVETVCSMSRVPVCTSVASLHSTDLAALRRLEETFGLPHIESVAQMPPSYPNGVVHLRLKHASRPATVLELVAGERPHVGDNDVVVTKAKGWATLGKALFGDASCDDVRAAWLHSPQPPPDREVPSLLLEALARIAGRAAGLDGALLGAPLRLVNGVARASRGASSGALVATIMQPCVCAHVRGERHDGDAHGATLELVKGAKGVLRLVVKCRHASGCNDVCVGEMPAAVDASLATLHDAAMQHAAAKTPPARGAAAAAIAAGRSILSALDKLPPAPSTAAMERMRMGSWVAFRASSEPHAGAILCQDKGAPRKRKFEAVGDEYACLMLRSFRGRSVIYEEALVEWKKSAVIQYDPCAVERAGVLLDPVTEAACLDKIAPSAPPTRAACVGEAARILRATDAFGVLCIAVAKAPPTASEVSTKYAAAHARLHANEASGAHYERALARLNGARDDLLHEPAELFERRTAAARPITSRLRCPIDVGALNAFAATDAALSIPVRKDGQPYGGAYRWRIQRLLEHVQMCKGSTITGILVIEYHHSALGAALVNAGFVSSSREYAVGADPFKESKLLRSLALGRFGLDFDDVASYPHARLAIIEAGSDVCRRFLKSRDTIMRQVGAHFFPNDPSPSSRRDKVKKLFNSLDMDGTYKGWRAKVGVSRSIGLEGLTISDDEGVAFSLKEYIDGQPAGTRELATKMPAMLEFIRAWIAANPTNDREHERTPERTLKSYHLQEMEGFSRAAKLRWCAANGHAAINLQHDGVVIALRGQMEEQAAREELRAVSSSALAYMQEVEVKKMSI